jgi:hypothetical protein
MFPIPGLTAGNGGTSVAAQFSFPYAIRARQLQAIVGTVGTNSTAGSNLCFVSGTTTTTAGSLLTGTATAGSVLSSTDMNAAIPANALCYIQNAGTDALAVNRLFLHYHMDPSGTWVG